ncbi:unnamed protein product [marine sediment metagenome]|uniref:Uncharacterized protein n=1 Tax=marine sediment metagenome TaxID=412755 RepID=X0UWL0_9ZZZZ
MLNLDNVSTTGCSHWNTSGDNYEFASFGDTSFERQFCSLLKHHIHIYRLSGKMRLYTPAKGESPCYIDMGRNGYDGHFGSIFGYA